MRKLFYARLALHDLPGLAQQRYPLVVGVLVRRILAFTDQHTAAGLVHVRPQYPADLSQAHAAGNRKAHDVDVRDLGIRTRLTHREPVENALQLISSWPAVPLAALAD